MKLEDLYARSKMQCVSDFNNMGYYFEKSVPQTFLMEVASGEKKILDRKLVSFMNSKLANQEFLAHDQLQSIFSTSKAGFKRYLPDEDFQQRRLMLANLLNTVSGGAFSYMANDLLHECEVRMDAIKSHQEPALDLGLTMELSRHAANNIHQFTKLIKKTKSGRNKMAPKMRKHFQDTLYEVKDQKMLTFQEWELAKGSSQELVDLARQVYKMKVDRKVLPKFIGAKLSAEGNLKYLLTMEYYLVYALSEEMLQAATLAKKLKELRADVFPQARQAANQLLCVLKSHTAFTKLSYGITLFGIDAEKIDFAIPTQKPVIRSYPCTIVLMKKALPTNLYIQTMKFLQDEVPTPVYSIPDMRGFTSQLIDPKPTYSCKGCNTLALNKYLSVFQCLHCICTNCLDSLKDSKFCFVCQSEQLVIYRGQRDPNPVIPQEVESFDESFFHDELVLQRMQEYKDALIPKDVIHIESEMQNQLLVEQQQEIAQLRQTQQRQDEENAKLRSMLNQMQFKQKFAGLSIASGQPSAIGQQVYSDDSSMKFPQATQSESQSFVQEEEVKVDQFQQPVLPESEMSEQMKGWSQYEYNYDDYETQLRQLEEESLGHIPMEVMTQVQYPHLEASHQVDNPEDSVITTDSKIGSRNKRRPKRVM